MKKSRLHRFSTHDGVIGAVVLLVVVALLGTLAVIYLRPPGQKSITFEVTDAPRSNRAKTSASPGSASGRSAR